MPQQLGVGVKFTVKLLVMGARLTMHLHPDYILFNIDLWNAYNDIFKIIVIDAHMQHDESNIGRLNWGQKQLFGRRRRQ